MQISGGLIGFDETKHQKLNVFHCRDIFETIDNYRFDYSGYYLVVLRDASSNQQQIIENIMNDFWSIYIVNVNILASNENDTEVKMYTYFPFAASQCEQAIPIVINHYANLSFSHPVEFPDKFRNMHECRVTAVTLPFEPYVILKQFANGSSILHGIEITVLKAIATHLNFTASISHISKQSVYSEMDKIAFHMV